MIEFLHVKSGRDLRSRLFVSHASEDREIASLVSRKLWDRQVPVWVDSERLTPGTSDWERAIREGIAQSLAVVVLASPEAQVSPYVRAELAIAKGQKIPILPAWVSGDHWSDCIPMDLIYSQYIDMRGEKQNAGIEILLEEVIALSRKSLPDHIVVDEADIAIVTERNGDRRITHDRAPAPPGFMTLLFNEVEYPKTSGRASVSGSFIRVGKYEVLGQLLDDIYQRYLIDRFDPLTYGTKWILKGVRGWNDVVLVPWTSLTEDIDTDDARSWLMNTRINDCGLIEGTPWTVVTPRSEELLYGVGAKNRKLISIVLEQPKALFFALRQGIFRRADDPSELGGAGVSYVIGRGRMRLIREGRVFIQADCDEIKVDQFLQYWGRF